MSSPSRWRRSSSAKGSACSTGSTGERLHRRSLKLFTRRTSRTCGTPSRNIDDRTHPGQHGWRGRSGRRFRRCSRRWSSLVVRQVHHVGAANQGWRLGPYRTLLPRPRRPSLCGSPPYRILRRQDSTPEVRGHIAEQVHEVQQDILLHKSWVRIQSSEVAEAYDSLLRAMREEAGAAMTRAWNTAPIFRDEDMPLGTGFSFPLMNAERVKYVEVVRWQLQPRVLRWARERLIPWLTERINRE